MPYDRELADTIRELLAHLPDVREVNMFGGLSFLVNEKMVASASAQGDLLVHCDPRDMGELLKHPDADIAQMGRRKMSKGWLRVTGDGFRTAENVEFWLRAALDYNERETGKNVRAK